MPSYLIYIISAKCNAKCKFCFYWQNIDNFQKNSHLELKLDEIEKFAKSLEKLQYVTLGGGEPFLREDLPEICKLFHDYNDVQQITIPTNGMFTDRIISYVKKMIEYCPNTYFRVSLSLDAIGEEHDKVRGVKGIFKNLTKTYERLSELRKTTKRLNIDISSVFSSFNQDNFKELIDYVHENFDVDNHNFLFVRGNPREKVSKNVSVEKYSEARKYYDSLKKRNENRPFSPVMRAMYETAMENIEKTVKHEKCVIPCRATINHLISVDETGNVYPCELLPEKKLGNLRDYDFDLRKMIETEKAKKTKKWILDSKCHCTWECAMNANLLYDVKSYPKLLKKTVEYSIK
ncbi:MAG: radical SAM protein [archaeon]